MENMENSQKIIDIRKEWLIWLLVATPLLYALYLWNALPEKLPIHWNYKGEIDGYSSKLIGALFFPGLNVVLYFILAFIPKLDPKKANYALFTGPYFAIRLAITAFLVMVNIIILRAGMGDQIEVGKYIPAGVFLLFAVLGNYITNVRPNYFVGIRTPWTLNNEEVWRKTHYLGGRIWFFAGIIGFIASMILPTDATFMLMPVIIIISFIPLVYSYVIYKKIEKEG